MLPTRGNDGDSIETPTLNRNEVTTLIEKQVAARNGLACDGLFTVRRSDKTGDLVLSFRSAGTILHYEIRGEKAGQLQIFKSTAAGIVNGDIFSSLLELCNYYKAPLPAVGSVMPCALTDQVTLGAPCSPLRGYPVVSPFS